ncbi:MAG: cytidine deaminase [Chloroflexi bacterium]|nr:cytidine deaminase [Chloroflexota bacterium]MCL5074284.1 cytidine deaminase [Chloroflexota bacterium]
MKTTTYNALNETQKRLLDAAEKATENAYNPYSHFSVGAALLTQDDQIIAAANVENTGMASICAERAAICRANAMGHRMFKAVAIIARGSKFGSPVDLATQEVTSPCGSCRQMLYEFAQVSGRDLETILSTTKKDKIVLTSINELLPLAFGPKDLGIDVTEYQK